MCLLFDPFICNMFVLLLFPLYCVSSWCFCVASLSSLCGTTRNLLEYLIKIEINII